METNDHHHTTVRKAGRPRLSVTDIKTTNLLRQAITKDRAHLTDLCGRLETAEQFIVSALNTSTDTDAWSLAPGDTESVRNRFVLSTVLSAGLKAVAEVRTEVKRLVSERSKRREAGAPLHVLRKAWAKNRRVHAAKTKRKGGVR